MTPEDTHIYYDLRRKVKKVKPVEHAHTHSSLDTHTHRHKEGKVKPVEHALPERLELVRSL